MNAILRFLQAARSLKNSGITKDQVLEFAKREFGEVSDFMRRQIDNIFKSPAPGAKSESKIGELFGFTNYPKTAQKKTGEVVPFKKKEGIESFGDIEPPKNLMRPGGGLDPVQGLTRTLVRRILMEKGISIDKADPIDIFDKTFGTDIAIDVKNLAEELLEMERMGKTPKDLDTILKQEGLLDIKIPENPARGMTDDELQKFLKETDEKQILDDFDPKDRDPNAKGGLAGIINL